MSVPLLMTKLFIPAPGKYLVRRAPLFEKLNRCLEPDSRLTLISAPAGFGKTTLVSAWLSTLQDSAPDCKAAWLSIDDGDNDPVIFWSYFIAALQTQQDGLGQQALNMLSTPGIDLVSNLPSLINDLALVRHPFVIVLDDYHLVRTPAIHQSLAFFIEHVPQHIHLVIASRTDPALPLALMRGRGQLLEIRLNDLRFSDEDAGIYLNGGIDLKLETQAVHALNQKTEGWIAGLQMATIALQSQLAARDQVSLTDSQKAADFVASFSGSNRFILDYLIEEVLNRQPVHIQHFLTQTSILDRLCAPLCDALLRDNQEPQPDAQSVLQHLENSNLFVFSLDDQRYWYRYHQLFADLLRKRLMQVAPERISALHHRAIQWYEQNGMIPSAIHHAFQLKDFQKAAALITQIAEVTWGHGEHATLLGWINALPEEEKKCSPGLLTLQVSMLISAGKMKEAEAIVTTIEQYVAASLESASEQDENPEWIALIGNVSALRTYIASFYGDKPALFAHARTALQSLTRDQDAGQRCVVSMVLGNAYLTQGDLDAANQVLVESISAGKKAGKPHMVLSSMANLATVQWFQGNLSDAEQICQEGLQIVSQHTADRSPMAVDISVTLGAVLCEHGAAQEAEPYIQHGLAIAQEQRYIWQAGWAYLAQARLLLAQGLLEEAETAAQITVDWCSAHEVPAHISCEAAGLLAAIWLYQGKTTQAEQYLQRREIPADGEILFPHASEYLALARLLWQQSELKTAAQILDQLIPWAEAHKQKGIEIAALLLRALVSQSAGDLQAGISFLGSALERAAPDGYSQLFVLNGEPTAGLLREAVKQNIQPQYAQHLLDAFPNPAPDQPPAMAAVQRKAAAPGTHPMVEPLSKRELETLQLIAEGFSNKEIAQKMYVSLRTVKYYSTGIYNKLGVDSRMQAVVRARELGLI